MLAVTICVLGNPACWNRIEMICRVEICEVINWRMLYCWAHLPCACWGQECCNLLLYQVLKLTEPSGVVLRLVSTANTLLGSWVTELKVSVTLSNAITLWNALVCRMFQHWRVYGTVTWCEALKLGLLRFTTAQTKPDPGGKCGLPGSINCE